MTHSIIELCVVFHHFAVDLNSSRSLEEEPGYVLVFNLLRGVVKLGSSYVDIEQVSDDYVGKFQALCMHDEMSTTFLRALSDILLETEDVSATTFTLRRNGLRKPVPEAEPSFKASTSCK